MLKDISFEAKSGEIVCIAGKNAVGKTTLLNIIAKTLKADFGKIQYSGKISLLTQEPMILPELSVEDNLKLWYAAADIKWSGFDVSLCEFMPSLFEQRRKRAGTLSGGMKKRLSIAAALVSNAEIFLLDEPFAALDPKSCIDLTKLLFRLKNDGKTVIFTSHEPRYIADCADRLLILQNGSLEYAAELYSLSADERYQAVLKALFGE